MIRSGSLAWSPDGKLIASAGGNEIHLWNPDDGKLKHALKGHKGPVNLRVAFRERQQGPRLRQRR